MWIQTLISLSHLLVILNSSVNFYIYLVKLHILHYTLTNCYHEEMNILSSKTKRTEIAKEIETRTIEDEDKELSSEEITRNFRNENGPEQNFKLVPFVSNSRSVYSLQSVTNHQ